MSSAKNVDHPKRKTNCNLVKAVEALTNLKEMNVSFHLVVHMEGKSQTFGTNNCVKTFDKYKKDFEEALIEDALDLCAAVIDDTEEVEEDVDPKNVAKKRAYKLKNGKELKRAPYPLSLMNRREKLGYLRYLISYDRNERLGLDSNRIVAGNETWEARFWPNEQVKWSELKINIGLIKSEHLNGESPTNFYTKVIEAALHMFKKDPEKYYLESTTDKMLKDRKRTFGIHEAPTIEQRVDASMNENDQNEERDSSLGSNKTYTLEKEGSTAGIVEEEEQYEFPAAATNNPVEPVPIVSRPHLEEQEDRGSPIYFELPEYLEGLAPAKKIRYNPGKGLCLAFSIAQHGNVDPKELKAYSNEKMVEWWVHIKAFVTFPLHITVGTGNQSYQKVINHQYELFSFLRGEESLYAFNTGEAEICILATIINQPIHLLIYNLLGFPPGTPLLDRCRMHSAHCPSKKLPDTQQYICDEGRCFPAL